jgi:hypothetical protein
MKRTGERIGGRGTILALRVSSRRICLDELYRSWRDTPSSFAGASVKILELARERRRVTIAEAAIPSRTMSGRSPIANC